LKQIVAMCKGRANAVKLVHHLFLYAAIRTIPFHEFRNSLVGPGPISLLHAAHGTGGGRSTIVSMACTHMRK
jgi:hypothetical protein